MLRLLLRFGLILLVLCQFSTPAAASRFKSDPYYSQNGYRDPKSVGYKSAALPPQQLPRRGLGLSAWSIVVLIVSIMLAGMGFYYCSMCCPTVCGTQSKYNKMGLINV